MFRELFLIPSKPRLICANLCRRQQLQGVPQTLGNVFVCDSIENDSLTIATLIDAKRRNMKSVQVSVMLNMGVIRHCRKIDFAQLAMRTTSRKWLIGHLNTG